jgi:hypothetical protein
MEGVTRAVDDRLQQLVPGPRRGREAGDVPDEAQLLELVALAARIRDLGSCLHGPSTSLAHARCLVHHVHHLTRVGTRGPAEGCGAVAAWLRYWRADRFAEAAA